MAFYHKVKEGDCISSIGFEHGFLPDTIWNHEKNAVLREKRGDGHVLMPDEDEVFVPDKRLKEVSVPTGQLHRFRLKSVPEILRIRFLDARDEPRANLPYTLEVDGRQRRAKTGADGFLVEYIPPDARKGTLLLGEGAAQQRFELNFGCLMPITNITGVQHRLNSLGYSCHNEEGEKGEKTVAALKAFQTDYNLEVTGESDQATLDKLKEVYLS